MTRLTMVQQNIASSPSHDRPIVIVFCRTIASSLHSTWPYPDSIRKIINNCIIIKCIDIYSTERLTDVCFWLISNVPNNKQMIMKIMENRNFKGKDNLMQTIQLFNPSYRCHRGQSQYKKDCDNEFRQMQVFHRSKECMGNECARRYYGSYFFSQCSPRQQIPDYIVVKFFILLVHFYTLHINVHFLFENLSQIGIN